MAVIAAIRPRCTTTVPQRRTAVRGDSAGANAQNARVAPGVIRMSHFVVTGANRGLGLEFVRQLLGRGERVIAGCRKPGLARPLTALAGAHPGRLSVLPLDITSEKSIAEFARESAMVTDHVDVLINNAGLLVSGERFGTIAGKSLAESFATNATGPLLLAQAFADLLAASKQPRIINISTQLASIANTTAPRTVSYAMSKAALNMATRLLAAELGGSGTIVVSVHPGWVQTDMGGPNAAISAEQSVGDLLVLLDTLTPEHNGAFIAHDGERLPW
jgi:NAD(P)-dependent dehydrogenase (short-subunit alcohol dehydrogenase family)